MPLRSAIYFGRTIEKIIEPKVLYRSGLIKIPTPEFFVFYNGEKPYPDKKILKLSDSYLEKSSDPMLELSVKVININLPRENPILAQCRPLYDSFYWLSLSRGLLLHIPLQYSTFCCTSRYSTSEKCGLSRLNTFSPSSPTTIVTAQKYTVSFGLSQNQFPVSMLSRYPATT